MEDKLKLYSDIERCEIININNGEKYNYLCDNDIIIDENGKFKLLIVNNNNKFHFNLFRNNDFLEIPWEYVNKVATKTIIVDIDESDFRKSYK